MTELNWCKILARVFTGNNYLVIDSLRFLMLGIYGWTLRQQSSSYCAHLGREVYLQSCIFHFLKCTVQWMWTSFLYCSHWLKLLDRHCNKDVGDTVSPIRTYSMFFRDNGEKKNGLHIFNSKVLQLHLCGLQALLTWLKGSSLSGSSRSSETIHPYH